MLELSTTIYFLFSISLSSIVGVLLSFILDLDVVGGGGCCEVPGCGGEGCGGGGGVGCSRGGVGGGDDDATPSPATSLLSLALLALAL